MMIAKNTESVSPMRIFLRPIPMGIIVISKEGRTGFALGHGMGRLKKSASDAILSSAYETIPFINV